MADTYEKDLAQKTSLTTSDFIRVVGSDNVSYKQLVSDVADKIIASRYLGYGFSSIASNADLNTYRTVGVYTCPSASVAQTLSNCPTTSSFRLEVKQLINAERYVQEMYVNSVTIPMFIRTYTGSWGEWVQYASASDNQGYRAVSRVALPATATVSFPSWRTMALIVVGRSDQFASLYLYSQGYAPVELFATASKPTVTLSADYTSITFSGFPSSGSAYIMVFSTSEKPTITAS